MRNEHIRLIAWPRRGNAYLISRRETGVKLARQAAFMPWSIKAKNW